MVANATHVLLLMTAYSARAGDAGAANGRSTFAYITTGSSAASAVATTPMASLPQLLPAGSFPGACSMAASAMQVQNATQAGAVVGATGCSCASLSIDNANVARVVQNCAAPAEDGGLRVFSSAPKGAWAVRQSQCVPGSSGCSPGCGLRTEAAQLQTLAQFLSAAGKPTGSPPAYERALLAVEVASSVPWPQPRGLVNALQTRLAPHTFRISVSPIGATVVG